jgi:carbon storage regulator
MLVLSRKSGEQLMIGDDIRVTIVGVRGGRVLLGIDAPTNVPILRGELHERCDEPIIIEVPANHEPAERSHPR